MPASSDAPEPTKHTLVDADGVTIYYYRWDVPEPRAIVHIAHGVGEYALRYARLAGELNAAGYSVVADDHRGHGESGLGHLGLSDLGPRSTRGAIDAVQRVGERIVSGAGTTPVVLLGHSWGSLMAQKIVARAPLYDGVILSGTSLAVPGVLNSGDLNKPWRGADASGLEWLSRDPAAREAFASDPLTFDIAVQPAWTMLQATAFLGRPPRRLPRPLPILIIGGSDDSLGGERGLTLLYRAYRYRSGAGDVTLRIYDGARHEVFNETNRDEVTADVVEWLDARFGPRG